MRELAKVQEAKAAQKEKPSKHAAGQGVEHRPPGAADAHARRRHAAGV